MSCHEHHGLSCKQATPIKCASFIRASWCLFIAIDKLITKTVVEWEVQLILLPGDVLCAALHYLMSTSQSLLRFAYEFSLPSRVRFDGTPWVPDTETPLPSYTCSVAHTHTHRQTLTHLFLMNEAAINRGWVRSGIQTTHSVRQHRVPQCPQPE